MIRIFVHVDDIQQRADNRVSPNQPDGRIVWDSADYATEEEEEAGLEAFIKKILDKPYEEE